MEELAQVLRVQVNQATQTRFRLSDVDRDQATQMLYSCYKAEVVKRRMEFIDDDVTRDRIQKAAKWLTGDFKPGLLMYGEACGTGKTTLGYAISNLVNFLYSSVYIQYRKVVYRTTSLHIAKLYQESQERYNGLINQELLFIDDIGTEPANIKIYGNEFSPVTELLYNRYDRQKWTLATSNLSDAQLAERYGARIDDRIKEMFERMHFQGKSYRK